MNSPSPAIYIAYGFSFLAVIIPFCGCDYLWKLTFFKKCLALAIISGLTGVILEVTNSLEQKSGQTLVLMSVSLVYLTYFQIFRWIFKRWYGTEPHVTSVSSSIGEPPLGLFTSENKDGKARKYEKGRRVMIADFVFSFAQALVPIFTIMALLFLTT